MRDYDNAGFTPADSRVCPFNVIDDKGIVMLVKYIGAQDSGTVTIASNNITFKHGAVGAEANDTSVGGAADSGATLDVSEGTENTLALCRDLINGSANWECVIIDGLPAEDSGLVFLEMSESQAKVPKGLQLLSDTSTSIAISALIAPDQVRTDIRVYYNGDGSIDPFKPFLGNRSSVEMLAGISTVTGADWFTITEQGPVDADVQQIYKAAGGTTGVELVALDGKQAPVTGQRGMKLVAGSYAATAFASAILRGQGRLFRALS